MGRSWVGRVVAASAVIATGVIGAVPATAAAAEADTSPPVLRSVSFSPTSITMQGGVVVTLDAVDDVGITKAGVMFLEDDSHRYTYVEDQISPLTVGTSFQSSSANGTHRAYEVHLWDAAGNRSIYRVGGYLWTNRGGAGTHDVDLATPGVTLTGASDRTPPVITSLTRGLAAARAGEPTTWSWKATDSESGLGTIQATFRHGQSDATFSTGVLPASPGEGSWTLSAPGAGEWRLETVVIGDSRGNTATYRADGRVEMPYALMPGRHEIAFGNLGLAVAPAAFSATVVARPGRLTVVLPDSITRPALTSVRITANPAGSVVDVPMSADAPLVIDVPELPNGVTQTLAVTLRSRWGDSPVTTVTGRPVLSRNVTGTVDVTGDRRADVFAQQPQGVGLPDTVRAYPGTGAGGLKPATTYLPQGQGPCASIAATDVGTLGRGELLCRNDDLVATAKGGGGSILGSRGWGSMQWLDGGFSANADASPDVIAMNPRGELLLYRKSTSDKLLAPTLIGTGWQSMISVVSAGDLDGDRRNDIVAVDAAGRLWLYPGNGSGGFTQRRPIGSGWQSMGALLPLRDFDGDGRADLGGITMGGELRLYRGTGTGTVKPGVVIGRGWQMFL